MKLNLLVICLFFNAALNAQSIEYKYDQNGNRIQRKLVVCNNCPQSGRVVSPEEEKKEQLVATQLGLSVFPNPSQEKVNVMINNLKAEDQATILLVDEQGKILVNQQTNSQDNDVDMSLYKAGIYFIKVMVGKETLFYKVIKL